MSSHVLILRSFSGMSPGEVIDTSDWVYGRATSLQEDRYIQALETADVDRAEPCPGDCGLTVLLSARTHDCDGLKRQRAEKVAEKVAAAKVQVQAAKASNAAASAATSAATAASAATSSA